MSNSIKLLKHASASATAANAVGKLIRGAGTGVVKAVKGGANIGANIAEGVGVNKGVGAVAGGAGVIGGGVAGADKLNQERKKWLYRHNFVRYG